MKLKTPNLTLSFRRRQLQKLLPPHLQLPQTCSLLAEKNAAASARRTQDWIPQAYSNELSLPDSYHRLQSRYTQQLGRSRLDNPDRVDARNLRVMQHLQATAKAAMTRKWLTVEAALAKLDVSSTVVVELRVKAAMITNIYTCSLVELLDARTLLCYPVYETCSWASSNCHLQVGSTSMIPCFKNTHTEGICSVWVLLKQALLTFGCTSSGGGRG